MNFERRMVFGRRHGWRTKTSKIVVYVRKNSIHCDANITVGSMFDPHSSSRRHASRCFSCGQIFCESCANTKLPLPSSNKPVRVCDLCRNHLLAQCAVNNPHRSWRANLSLVISFSPSYQQKKSMSNTWFIFFSSLLFLLLLHSNERLVESWGLNIDTSLPLNSLVVFFF